MGNTKRAGVLRTTTLTAALLTAYGYAPGAAAVDLTIDTPYDLGSSTLSNSTVTVNDGGDATGDGTQISGSAYDVVLINSGGKLSLDNATISNDLDDPKGKNGRAIRAEGVGAAASLTNSTIVISAQSTDPGTDYAHAFTASVGAAHGGHVDLNGGSITASGSKRTVGIQANDGGSISATGIQITTDGTFGHAVQAYRTPTAAELATRIDLKQVFITTHSSTYAVGIQSANKGASVTANDTNILTEGAGSFGIESFNGASVDYSGGSVTTLGVGAAGIRVYGGVLGAGSVNVDNAVVSTRGDGAAGVSVGTGGAFTATGATLVSDKSDGIVLTDNATVQLTGTRVDAARASLVSNLNSAGQTQNIVIGSGSTLTANDGTLLRVNRSAAGMDGIVNLTLQAGSNVSGDIVDLDGLSVDAAIRAQSGKTNFIVGQGASWVGSVRGIDDVTADDGGSFTDNGNAPIGGNVTGGENSTIVFTNGAAIGGGVTVGRDSTAAFQGTTSIGGSVVGGPGSSFAFDGATNIGQGIAGNGTVFEFSKTEATAIGGDVVLDNSASLKGGDIATPIAIAGNVTAGNGATLGGNLFVQGTLNGAGSTVSPGNSVGTQSYASIGSFGSTYKAEVNAAGKSDLVIARTGNIDLAGTQLQVAQENGNGGYLLGHGYTIVQTVDGNVTGQFASAGLDQSFANTLVTLDPVEYASKDVKIRLSLDESKVGALRPSLSSNQNHTLDGVISVAGRNAAANAALTSTDSKGALNQLSGEIHASTQAALLQTSGLVQRTVSDRLRGNWNGGATQPLSTSSSSASSSGSSHPSAYPLWAQVIGDRYTLSGDGNAAKVKNSVGGLFLGGDAGIGKGWRLGGAVGYLDNDIKVDDRASRSNVKSYTAALYGGNSWQAGKGELEFLAGAGYTHHDIDTHRTVTVGGSQALKASYQADSVQLFTELGYAIPVGASTQVGPYVGVAWLNQHVDGFSESGGPAALKANGQTDSTTTTTLGLRGNTTFDIGRTRATLNAGLGWRHADGDIDVTRKVAFVQGNGVAFDVAGAPIAQDAAVVNVGAEFALGKRTAMGLSYNGQFGGGNTDNNGTVYLKVLF